VPKIPEVVGLLLCERLSFDRATHFATLAGLFQSLRFEQFPSPEKAFTVYAALYGGEGEGTIELTVMRLETEDDIYSYQRWFTFPDDQPLINL
jgi:hypothetical protein